jgi:hypothetical protein
MVGAKRALKPQQVWAMGFWLDRERRLRDRALFDLAIDSKLRGCDVAKIRIGELVSSGRVRTGATVTQQKIGRPVQSELLEAARSSLQAWLEQRGGALDDYAFLSRTDHARHISTRRYARLVDEWVTAIGPRREDYGTHSLRRTKHRSSTRRPAICGRCSSCSERRHTAHEHLIEGRIYYRFHPRCGETVLIKRQLEHRGVVLVVILQPDSSLACIPLWMTHEAAAQYTLSETPYFSVDILRSMRAEINALLGFLQPESKAEEADNVAPIQRSSTKPVRGERDVPSRVGDRTDGRGRGIGGNSSARDRDSAGKLGGQR